MDRNTTSYRYAADGRKLRATYKTFPGQHVGDDDRYTERNDSGLVRPGNGRIFVPSTVVETKTVDYVGNLIYEDNVIKKILIDGGYITFNEGNAPEYHFYIKDHLGNNRVVVHTSGEVEQVNHYYPYGGLMAESTNWNTQWYKYNGKARANESRESMYALLCRVQPRLDTVKELDRMHGLDWYDYGARWQDAAIGGRWHAMDPLCEKYYDVSPYVYCMNNPVKFVDPDGRKVRPAGNAELVMIKNTIPYEARQYVVLDSDGYIDETTLNFYDGQSVNFSNLKELVASPRFIDVKLDDEFDFADKEGVVGHATMSYEPCNSETMDKNGEVSIGGLSTGESGFMGKTLFPDRDGYQNSTNSNIQVIVNKNLSHAGAAESYSHEANGHALLYVRNGGNHTGASHQPVGEGWTEGNMTLKKMIIDSKKETIKNMN